MATRGKEHAYFRVVEKYHAEITDKLIDGGYKMYPCEPWEFFRAIECRSVSVYDINDQTLFI